MFHNLLPIVCLAWTVTGCAGASPAVGTAPASRGDSVTIVVENQNFYDAHVYAEFDGFLVDKLGMVPGFARDTFVVAWRSSRLKMRTRFVGAGRTVSDDLHVTPGDVVELIIQPQSHRNRAP